MGSHNEKSHSGKRNWQSESGEADAMSRPYEVLTGQGTAILHSKESSMQDKQTNRNDSIADPNRVNVLTSRCVRLLIS